MRVEVSESIGRSPADVFRFVATDHVQNHPRWDPDMRMVQETPGPIGVGTRIRRNVTRSGTAVEGVMEVTEFEQNRVMGVVIRDGDGPEIRSRATVAADGETATRLTLALELDAPAGMDPEPMRERMRTSLRRMKELIEAHG